MKAIILAAGVGRRLGEVTHEPKSLLRFNSRSLMQRHIDNLADLGVDRICLCLGYQQEKILSHIRIPKEIEVSSTFNPDFEQGSMLSLWAMREEFDQTQDTLLMDADVLYEQSILAQLVGAKRADLLLIDCEFAAGDEPVKICMKNGQIVEFRKTLAADLKFDKIGESVGFFRFSPEMGLALIEHTAEYVESGRHDAPCEEAIRDLILANAERFAVRDITGKQWIEIDFPEDVERAEKEILPFVDD